MHPNDQHPTEILKRLREAKTWPDRLRAERERGQDIRPEMSALDQSVADLEKQAQEAMKDLGCVSPETRVVYRAMADMLIAWHAFKDSAAD